MRIAIALAENKLDVSPIFGRAAYFLIYDSEGETENIVLNPGNSAYGGAGIRAAQFLVRQNVNVLLTFRLGENALSVLRSAEIKIYRAELVGAKDNIVLYKAGKLTLLDSFRRGFQGGR